jgi:hypothetical protein
LGIPLKLLAIPLIQKTFSLCSDMPRKCCIDRLKSQSVADVQEQPKIKRTGTFSELLDLMVGVR